PIGINQLGQIVGDADANNGFLYSGGTFTLLHDPSAATTQALGINDAGQIVGYNYNGGANTHGFLYSGGSYTAIDDPLGVSTVANGINNSGQIVGQYTDGSGPPP